MKLDEQTLLAYVDGVLEEERLVEVEAALATDAQARDFVNQLRAASPDVIKTAFDLTLGRALPQPLLDQIGAEQSPTRSETGSRVLLAVAASIALVAVGVLAGYVLRGSSVGHADHDEWITRVAQYQVLYGRETLALPNPTPVSIRATEVRLGERLGLKLRIPDLDAHDLAFKRGQLLAHNGDPLVQLTYLPVQGKPVAYCIMKTDQGDSAPVAGTAEGLELVHWRHGGFAFVIIGEMKREALRPVAESAFRASTSS